VASRTGRLVLRGTSPSARLLAHRDLTTPVTPGVLRDATPGTMAEMAGHAMSHNAMTSTTSWRMAPMPPRMTMMPGMSGLVPSTAPYLPAAGTPRVSQPGVIKLRDGDTVSLSPRPIATTVAARPVTLLGYNGSLPGPRLEVAQGARVAVRVTNAL